MLQVIDKGEGRELQARRYVTSILYEGPAEVHRCKLQIFAWPSKSRFTFSRA